MLDIDPIYVFVCTCWHNVHILVSGKGQHVKLKRQLGGLGHTKLIEYRITLNIWLWNFYYAKFIKSLLFCLRLFLLRFCLFKIFNEIKLTIGRSSDVNYPKIIIFRKMFWNFENLRNHSQVSQANSMLGFKKNINIWYV